METLPINIFRLTYQHLDGSSLANASILNIHVSNKICNDIFWINKIQYLIPFNRSEIDICKQNNTYKAFYFYLYDSKDRCKDIDEWIFKFTCLGNVEIVNILLNMGNLENMEKYILEDALSEACQENRFEIVKLLIDYGVEVVVLGGLNFQPIMLASENGNIEILKLLLDNLCYSTDDILLNIITASTAVAFSNGRQDILRLISDLN